MQFEHDDHLGMLVSQEKNKEGKTRDVSYTNLELALSWQLGYSQNAYSQGGTWIELAIG